MQYTGVAESIESEDATVWTVTLKDGWTFHDDTRERGVLRQGLELHRAEHQRPGRLVLHGQDPGYDDLQAETDDAGNVVTPAAEEMSGLEVVDETTFTERPWARRSRSSR